MVQVIINLRDDIATEVETISKIAGYRNSSEFAESLISQHVKQMLSRAEGMKQFNALVQDGLDSGLGPVADEKYFADLYARVEREAEA